ncbi:hypothetical protein JXB28_04105 [Candidatus Woesearchaeota archaeon]|nr:hypothetical protein [Candidatus Woesearchaeota archaeon]
MNLLFNALIFAYAGVGVVQTIGYWPTLKDLYYKKKKSANISSYAIWTFCSGITFLYAVFILPDLLFQAVSGVEFAACAAILLFSIRLKNAP